MFKKNKEIIKLSKEQQKCLAFGSIIFEENGETIETLKLRGSEKRYKKMLRDWWEIEDHNEALKVVTYLSNAQGHTPFTNDIYNEFVKKDKPLPFTPKGLQEITGLENAYLSSAKRILSSVGILDSEMTPKFMEEVMMDEQFKQETIPLELFERLTTGMECFKIASDILIRLGYKEQELKQINTLAAWDYGRAVFVARDCYHVGYLSEEEAWQYITLAVLNATNTYSNWREYIAAYILGRAIGFGSDCTDHYKTLDYLLNNNESPLNTNSFK